MCLLTFCVPAGISVSISTFSLVAIAIERYSAICNPLKSRVWQTRSHAYRVIATTWVLALIIMIPYPVISHLESFQRPDNTTAHQCRHKWPVTTAEQTWWVFDSFIIHISSVSHYNEYDMFFLIVKKMLMNSNHCDYKQWLQDDGNLPSLPKIPLSHLL